MLKISSLLFVCVFITLVGSQTKKVGWMDVDQFDTKLLWSFYNKTSNDIMKPNLEELKEIMPQRDPQFQQIHKTFGEIPKLHKPKIAFGQCKTLTRQLRLIRKSGRAAYDWLIKLIDQLPKHYFRQFNYFEGHDEKSLQLLADALLTNGKHQAANKLLEQHLAHKNDTQLNAQFCNKIIEGLLDEMLFEHFEAQAHASNQIARNEELFDEGCRGDWTRTLAEEAELNCFYESKMSPIFRIAPVKVEVLNVVPYIARYHELISEREISYLLNQTANKVRRSQVNDVVKKTTSSRSSSDAVLDSSYLLDMKKLMQRLAAVTHTNLAMVNEPMTVIRYRVGELYKLHYDFDLNMSKTFDSSGNRLISAMFYLTNVQEGGETIFPYLQLSVKPVRGSLLLWHNLHSSLAFDYRTKHGGCPVKKGVKWVAIQWIHNKHQEFEQPCALENDDYKSHDYLQDC